MAKKKGLKASKVAGSKARKPTLRAVRSSKPQAADGGVGHSGVQGEIGELTRLAVQFRDDRDWKQFHNPKDMALSMALEVAEVVELMQWKNGEALQQHLRARRDDLGDELSDVLYWILTIANDFGIDLARAFEQKLIKSAQKYPVEKSRGRSNKYTEL